MPPKNRRPKLTPEEAAAKAEEERKEAVAALLAKAQDELKLARAKRSDVDAKWRKILSATHTEKQRQLVGVLSAEHERVVDAKNAQITRLQEHIEEATGQYELALRTHFTNVEALRQIHDARAEQMRAEFCDELQEWQEAFDQERESTANKYDLERAEFVDVIRAMDEHHQREMDAERRRIQEQRNSVKNKHTEEFEDIRVALQKRITELEDHFQQTLETYERTTEVEIQKMNERIADDDKKSHAIDVNNRRLERIQRSIANWRAKMASNTKECETRNQSLKEEKEAIVAHFHLLKSRMTRFRDNQNERMVQLTQAADASIKELDVRVKLAEKILVLSELTGKLLTEREKIDPLGPPSLTSEAEIKQEREDRLGNEEDPLATVRSIWKSKSGSSASVHQGACIQDESGEIVEPWDALQNFYKRVNKVQLDVAALEHEEDVLARENRELKEALARYADGTTMTESTLDDEENSLFIVNDRTPHAIALGTTIQSLGTGVVEGQDMGLAVTAATLMDTADYDPNVPDGMKLPHQVKPGKFRNRDRQQTQAAPQEQELVYEYA